MRWTFLGILAASLMVAQQQQSPPAQPKAPAKAVKKEAAKEATPEPPKPATPQPPAPPKQRREYQYVYDQQGRPVQDRPGVSEERKGTGPGSVVERQETQRDFDGRAIPSRTSQERVLDERDENRTSERAVQRYDPTGRPTARQLIRTERRKMPDGSIVTTETTYEEDLNRRMQFTERRSTTERKTATGANTAILVERPAFGGGGQVVERIDRVETKKSDTITETVGSRKFLDANGRFEERERELSVAAKTGENTNTETHQWQLGATGQMDLVSRSLSRLHEKADGTQTEDIDVYTTRIAGTTPDLNQPQVPSLEQQVRREKKVQPDGKFVETTSTRFRNVTDPTRMDGFSVEERVATPTADGRTIQRTLRERDSNGKMLRTQSSVEEEKK